VVKVGGIKGREKNGLRSMIAQHENWQLIMGSRAGGGGGGEKKRRGKREGSH